jgi:hypothetical protein
MEWCGRAAAVMENLGPTYGVPFNTALAGLGQGRQFEDPALLAIPRLLHQARHKLRMETLGPVNTALGAGAVFDYFDELRQIIEPAADDLLFIDPYIGSEFVSRYLPHVRHGVVVRLLTRKSIPQLLPAVETFATQYRLSIYVRSAGDLHDRFVIVDGQAAYQSGASFQDGAKKSPTTLTQITDVFQQIKQQYEDRWTHGQRHR